MTYFLSQNADFCILYGDACSRLVQTKLFISRGFHFRSLGMIWLPLADLIFAPFVLSQKLLSTGLAGAIPNLILHCLSSTLIFSISQKLIKKTKSNLTVSNIILISLISSFLYFFNPNLLYLSYTAMSETPALFLFILSLFYFEKYIFGNNETEKNLNDQNSNSYLLSISIIISLLCLTRYEYWIVAPVFSMILIIEFLNKKIKFLDCFLYSFISGIGILTWMSWNWYAAKSPLFFANAQYYSTSWQSAHQLLRENPIYDNFSPTTIMFLSLIAIFSPMMLIIALSSFKKFIKINLSFFVLIISPFVFQFVLILMNKAEIHIWLNSRYILTITPFLYLALGLVLSNFFQSKSKQYIKSLLSISIVLWFIASLFLPTVLMPTYADAALGFKMKNSQDSFNTGEILNNLEYKHVLLLTNSGKSHRILLQSGLDFSKVDVGILNNKKYIDARMNLDQNHYDVIIINRNSISGDCILVDFKLEDWISSFENRYQIVHENNSYFVYNLNKNK